MFPHNGLLHNVLHLDLGDVYDPLSLHVSVLFTEEQAEAVCGS